MHYLLSLSQSLERELTLSEHAGAGRCTRSVSFNLDHHLQIETKNPSITRYLRKTTSTGENNLNWYKKWKKALIMYCESPQRVKVSRPKTDKEKIRGSYVKKGLLSGEPGWCRQLSI